MPALKGTIHYNIVKIADKIAEFIGGEHIGTAHYNKPVPVVGAVIRRMNMAVRICGKAAPLIKVLSAY